MNGPRDEWLTWRARGIGASDVAGILGISPWTSPWAVWAEKRGLTPPGEESELMEFGRRAEVMIGPWFHDVTGLWVTGEQTWCRHPAHDWARATVDGFVAEIEYPRPDELTGVLEIKTTGPGRDWDQIPPYYAAQGQWQLFVTGLPVVHFAVLHGRRFRTYTLEANTDDQEFIRERVESFWFNNVQANIPPPVDGAEATGWAISTAFGIPSDDTTIEVDPELVAALRATRATLKTAENREAEAANALKVALGEATLGTVGGMQVCSWRVRDRTSIDVKALTADMPDVAEKYRTLTQSRVLLLSKERL